MSEPTLPFFTRLWFAWLCYFRVLLDGAFAKRAYDVQTGAPALPPPEADEPAPETKRSASDAPSVKPKPEPTAANDPKAEERAREAADRAALSLLSLLQREGRLIDFLQQDIESFADEEIGAAVRVVHAGCRKALKEHMQIDPVRSEPEGEAVKVEDGFSPAEVKLTGDVRGDAPYSGTLRHRGWRASELKLPVPMKGHDAQVIAPAEVEL